MNGIWLFVPWVNRVILLAPLAIFILLTVRIITDPVRSATDHGMAFISPVGLTNYRSGNGGIFLGFAIFTLSCLVSTRRALVGLTFVAIMMGVILVLRSISAVVDATVSEQVPLLVAETVFLILSSIGIVLELARRRREDPLAVRPNVPVGSAAPGFVRDDRQTGAGTHFNGAGQEMADRAPTSH
jgi:hypothetical protein